MRLKTLSLVAVAAVAAMAFVGASTATAAPEHPEIVLCKVLQLPCAKENWYPNPTTIVAHANDPTLSTSIGTILCEKSLAKETVLNELKPLIIGHLLELTFENCKLGSTSCIVTVPALGLISITPGEKKLTAIAKSTGGTEANVKCGFLINCTYGGEPALETHSNEAGETHLLANATELTRTKGFCPETSKWNADYLALGTYYIEL